MRRRKSRAHLIGSTCLACKVSIPFPLQRLSREDPGLDQPNGVSARMGGGHNLSTCKPWSFFKAKFKRKREVGKLVVK